MGRQTHVRAAVLPFKPDHAARMGGRALRGNRNGQKLSRFALAVIAHHTQIGPVR